MAGTKTGGLKHAKKMRRRYGRNYYQRIGAMGGKSGTAGGWYHMMVNDNAKHKELSSKGGRTSRRGPALENS